jgi:MoaA/NifB/PqqE/SkfB family radical SAM enzyme
MIAAVIGKNIFSRTAANAEKNPAKRLLIKGVTAIRQAGVRRLQTPESIVFFVTDRCQMRCGFCFVRESLNRENPQLSIPEIRCLAMSLKNPARISLTGGEPFLRKDIDEICSVFNACGKTRGISISTNGFLTATIRNTLIRTLQANGSGYLKIQVSIDALGEKHDCLRGCPGAFENAAATLRMLRALQKTYRNLQVEIASLVNACLMEDIKEFVAYFQDLRMPIKFCIMRTSGFGRFGLAEKDESRLPPLEAYIVPSREQLERFYCRVKELNACSSYKFWTLFQQKKFEHTLAVLKTEKKSMPCYAGTADAVIYGNGDVAFCENTKARGNLRDYNFDLAALWRSTRENDFLKEGIKRCACIHGCNIITSMAYDAATLADIL